MRHFLVEHRSAGRAEGGVNDDPRRWATFLYRVGEGVGEIFVVLSGRVGIVGERPRW